MEDKSNRESTEREKDDTKAYDIKDIMTRRTCPFHGFKVISEIDTENYTSRNFMEDGKGDSCALSEIINIPDRSYCMMEEPNWANCSLNTVENRLKLLSCPKKITVYPKDLQPAGMPLKSWTEYIENILY